MTIKGISIFSSVLAGLALLIILSVGNDTPKKTSSVGMVSLPIDSAITQPLPTAYGMPIDSSKTYFGTVQKNEFLSDILTRHNIDYPTIDKIVNKSRPIFDVRRLRAGNPYCVITTANDSTEVATCMIYEENKVDYVVFHFDDSLSVYRGKKQVKTIEKTASGVIESSLYMTMYENGINTELAMRLSEIYAWTIDFYRIQKGDRFKILYTEKFVEDESVGIGDIKAVMFNHLDRELYGFYHEKDSIHYGDYFDPNGRSLRKAFLQAPVKFSRISSKYTRRRFHPVQKRYKAHLGTDYAAPHGTPIYATADGTVTAAAYKRYNGRYVKIRHNGTYTTQYLHMSRIGKEIKPGVFVKQGEVIGYVGSTGLATGPHVCYRFWKNGSQVDPYKQDIPDADPLTGEELKSFQAFIVNIKKDLDAIPYPERLKDSQPLAFGNQ